MVRTVYGQWGVDWEERVNFERLRIERMERVRKLLKEQGFEAIIAFDPSNIKYTTGTFGGGLTRLQGACSILARSGDPVLFEIGGDIGRQKECAPWIKDIRPAIPLAFAPLPYVEKWATNVKNVLKDLGVADGRVGIDRIPAGGMRTINTLKQAGIPVEECQIMKNAREIKTVEEIKCIKLAVMLAEPAFQVAYETIKPGVTEAYVQAKMNFVLLKMGCTTVGIGPIASGEHTNPYWRRYTNDKIIRYGDLVIKDCVHEWNGYWCDYVRTFLCGSHATKNQKELYKKCYDHLYSAINIIKPGVTTAEIDEKLADAEDFSDYTLQYAHGIGLDFWEWPVVSAFSKSFPERIEKNMVLAVETWDGYEGSDGKYGVRLEENLVVTETGVEIISKYPHDERLLE